ncbi:MAG: CDP-diacylglycerol--glycerol-3-phosphate 3-phosphatidyltransferase [Bacilli bacterium]|jgi:CDP-diacylglycerol--glycerol-3-phosphate 3-phosphatidyltransferase|nr:CDP-diacylglycerol--glycerol-3-phosphate 3-phosphatidyltransferase [Bacilli bacterium]
MNIPTKITVSRIVLIGVMLLGLFVISFIPDFPAAFLPGTQISLVYFVCFWIFAVAAVTDKIDGTLARKWHQVTDLGKFLDPVADKLLVDSSLIVLTVPALFAPDNILVPVYCTVIMIVRDLVVDSLRFIAAGKGKVLSANVFGKVKTVCQMVAIPLFFLNDWPFSYFDASWGLGRLSYVFMFVATLASLISGVVYLVQNRDVFKEAE